MRVSLIAAYYKDIVALKRIIESLRRQDYDDFEFIVAEDNCDESIRSYISSITDFDIIHTYQEDIGNRKARSINNAILRSTGDYLIFIDADCVPYHNFISSHVRLAEEGHVLSGRRVNLGPRVSSLLRNCRLQPATLEKFYFLFMPLLTLDGGTHLEQGISLDPEGFIYSNMISGRKKSNVKLLGCNFSCFKKDMLAINGFDESYPGESCIADDTDLNWRFTSFGLQLKSCKLSANVFHLHHGTRDRPSIDGKSELARMETRKANNAFRAEVGLDSH